MSIFAIEKLSILWQSIKANGGIIRQLEKMWRMDTFKAGTLVGWDENGNKYYENNRFMIPRNRWVEYNPVYKWEYEGSQISPEWFGWIHHKTDLIPCQDCAKYQLYCCQCPTTTWLLGAEENQTATEGAYYPYSTTKPHIKCWDGRSVCNRK